MDEKARRELRDSLDNLINRLIKAELLSAIVFLNCLRASCGAPRLRGMPDDGIPLCARRSRDCPYHHGSDADELSRYSTAVPEDHMTLPCGLTTGQRCPGETQSECDAAQAGRDRLQPNGLARAGRCSNPQQLNEILWRMKNMLPRTLAFAVVLLFAFTTTALNAQDWAKTRLEASPRHGEYTTVKHDGRTVDAMVVYAEVKQKAPVVILIHEIFGLTDWAKEMADELAGQGFIVIAPDLLSGDGPKGGGSNDFPDQDARVKGVSGLDPDAVMADLDAAADYGKKLPAANGKIAVAGFCWGGSKSFAFAAHRKDLSAAFVFYGTGPADVSSVTAPG